MALNRKLMASITSVSLVALIVSGTFAWTSLNSQKVNEWHGSGAPGTGPGGTLHDDHEDNESNKDVYVENWGDEDLFVRIKLSEYMEAGQGAGLKSVSTNPATGEIIHNPLNLSEPIQSGDLDHLNTWVSIWHRFYDIGDLADKIAPEDSLISYWEWDMGGQKYYYPAPEGSRTDKGYVDQNSPDDLTADSMNENDILAKQTHPATIITMNEWKNAGRPVGDYWVIDRTLGSNIWAYWAAPLRPGEATGLLLNKVTKIDTAFNSYANFYDFNKGYYYGINVEAQMATKDGDKDANGLTDNYIRFGDEAQGGWSADGQELIEKIVQWSTDSNN